MTGFHPKPNRESFRNRPHWRLRKTSWDLSTEKTIVSMKDEGSLDVLGSFLVQIRLLG